MPLVLIKTTEKPDLDHQIAEEITAVTMNELGVVESDVAVKFENATFCRIDLYLYDQKQYPYQKERTDDVFARLEKNVREAVTKLSGKEFEIEVHLILKERCFRAGRPRF